ncbi:hypothetical protein [Actinopolymorpha pittospori]
MSTVIVSFASVGVAVMWLLAPGTYPFGATDRVTVSVTHLIGNHLAGALLLAAGITGLVVSVAGARLDRHDPSGPFDASGRRDRIARRLVAVGAVAEAAFFAFVMADASLLSTLGYALALVGPVAVVVAVVIACLRRHRTGYLAALSLVAVALVGIAAGVLNPATLVALDHNVMTGFETYGARVGWSWAMAAAAVGWAFGAARALWNLAPATRRRNGVAHADPAARAGMSVVAARWSRVVTVVAALCPLPYGLVRLSWLTPWPLGMEPAYDTLATRVQGAAIGTGAIIGAVLTLGLVARWGERFPTWLPFLGGRDVPVRLAVVPGAVVAGTLLIATPGLLLTVVAMGDLARIAGLLVLFPLPLWGPALGAAVLGYRLRRMGEPRTRSGAAAA